MKRESIEMGSECVEGRSKILVFGGTGYIGKYMVEASVSLGHPTFVYARPLSPDQTSSSKTQLRNQLLSMGVTIIEGRLDEQEKMVEALRQVDVVISVLAIPQVLDQLKIINAIKLAGNIKRFLPSDFGVDEDEVRPLPPFQKVLDKKKRIRRVIEESGIPYTFVSANCFGAYFVNYLLHPHTTHQQDHTITVYGNGDAKAVLNYEGDVAVWTIKVANDPRTLNKRVTFRPSENIVTQLEMINIWEKKTGKTFNKVHVSEQELVKLSQSLPEPQNIPVAILHCLFVKGELMNFQVSEDTGSNIIECSRLYPEWELTTLVQLLDMFLLDDPPKPASAAFE